MYTLASHICLICALFVAVFAEIPPYIKICNRKDPEVNKCISNSIENLREKLATGIPELDAPSIEPFRLNNIRLLRGPQSARFDVNLTNVEVIGASKFKLGDLQTDVDNLIFTFKVLINRLDFHGQYRMDTQILLLRLKGDGNFNGIIHGYTCDSYLKAHKVIRNNNTYIHFEKMKFKININKTNFYFDNLFDGNPVFGSVTNQILNDNSDLFVEEIKPSLIDVLSNLFTTISNKITERFTYDELFPI